jgi:hypothetical protein
LSSCRLAQEIWGNIDPGFKAAFYNSASANVVETLAGLNRA